MANLASAVYQRNSASSKVASASREHRGLVLSCVCPTSLGALLSRSYSSFCISARCKARFFKQARPRAGRRPMTLKPPITIFLPALALSGCLHFCHSGVFAQNAVAPSPQPKPVLVLPPLREHRDFAMLHDGNPVRGRELFFSQEQAACARCHSVDGSSSKA